MKKSEPPENQKTTGRVNRVSLSQGKNRSARTASWAGDLGGGHAPLSRHFLPKTSLE